MGKRRRTFVQARHLRSLLAKDVWDDDDMTYVRWALDQVATWYEGQNHFLGKMSLATRKLTPEQAREIRARYQAGHSQAGLGREFGLTQAAVWQLIHDKCYTQEECYPTAEETRAAAALPPPPGKPRAVKPAPRTATRKDWLTEEGGVRLSSAVSLANRGRALPPATKDKIRQARNAYLAARTAEEG